MKAKTQGGLPLLQRTAMAVVLLASMPAAAQVQAGCTGSNPGTVICPGPNDTTPGPAGPATYAAGIVHQANGGNLTVRSGDGITSYGTGGFVTTATGANNLTIIKGPGNLSNNATAGTRAPVVIGATTGAGDINIMTEGTVQGAAAFVQHGIRAQSTAGGDISITSTGNVSVSTSASNPGVAGITAITNGGHIQLNVTNVSGPMGVNAQNTTGQIVMTGSTAAVNAVTTTGAISLTNTGGNITAQSISGDITASRTSSNGNFMLTTAGNIVANRVGTGTTMTDTSSGAGTTHLTLGTGNAGLVTVRAGSGDVTIDRLGVAGTLSGIEFLSGTGAAAINISGSNAINRGTLGSINAIGLTGAQGVMLDIGAFGSWSASTGTSTFSGAGDRVRILADGQLRTSATTDDLWTTVDFAAGQDELVNEGNLLVGARSTLRFDAVNPGVDQLDSSLTLSNLETFTNRGSIILGAFVFEGGASQGAGGNDSPPVVNTDLRQNDLLSLPGVDFVGEAGSRIKLNAALGSVQPGIQSSCDDALRGEVQEGSPVVVARDLPVADCVDLKGGTASGRTAIDIVEVQRFERGAYDPTGFVLVDVAGGSADPDAFFVGDESTNYSPAMGGIVDKGLFAYAIGYDETTDQFKLYGVEGAAGQQFPLIAQAGNELWRTSGSAWLDRQVDQRDVESSAGYGGSIWIRTASVSADRDQFNAVAAGHRTLNFDNTGRRDDITTTFGIDLLAANREGLSWAIGPMIGYARSRLSFESSSNRTNIEGTHYGVYGSITLGGLYLDAALNQLNATVDNRVPALDVPEAAALLSSDLTSFGGQLEAGWRLLSGKVQLEPLVSLSTVTSKLDGIRVPNADPNETGAQVNFADSTSTRAGVGVRLGLNDLAPSLVPIGLNLTAKVAQESDGDAQVTVENAGPNMVTSDVLDGTFSEISAALSITNRAKTAAGYLNIDTVFGDDYESLGFSAGFRLQW